MEDTSAVRRLLLKYPVPAWAESGGGRWFEHDQESLATRFQPAGGLSTALARMVSELVDWRLAAYLDKSSMTYEEPSLPLLAEAAAADGPPIFQHAASGLELWQEYKREAIPRLFGTTFNPGAWNAGIVMIEERRAMILLVTLKKGSLSSGNHYEDSFEGPTTFVWQTQTSTRRESRRGRIISGAESGWTVHLFVRSSKLRNGVAAPFRYCGPVSFIDWEGNAPITVQWSLAESVPEHLRRALSVDAQ